MTNLREAAEMALKALIEYEEHEEQEYGFHRKMAEIDALGGTPPAIVALRAALAEPQEPEAWAPVTEAMPKSGVKVLACYRNRLGNLRRIRAMWTAAKTEEASSEDAEACSEYDEATDTYYVTEGWYECIDNWGDYSSVAVTEGEVTHWMPLPPDPDSAPPQRPAEPVQEPVAWRFEARHIDSAWGAAVSLKHPGPEGVYMRNVVPLYTAPPQRKPLTEEEISNIWDGHVAPVFGKNGINPIVFARAIERAHGIGGQP